MRDVRRVVEALERKAADSAVTTAERDALTAKAAELREHHQVPTQASTPPRPPAPPVRTATGTADFGWSNGGVTFNGNTTSTSNGWAVWFR